MKYNKVYRKANKNAVWPVYEDHVASLANNMLTEEETGIDNIIKTLKHYIKHGFPMKWESHFVLPDGRDITEYCDNAIVFGFDYSNFKGKAKIMNNLRFFLFLSSDKQPLEFFINEFTRGDDFGYYFLEYSNIDHDNPENNYGTICINFRYFLQEWAKTDDQDLLFNQLEEVIFHEIRHYYDHIIGEFYVNNDNKIIDLETWGDECFGEIPIDKIDDIIKTAVYIMDNSELNAYTQSFYVLIKKLILSNPDITKDELIDYIYTNAETHWPYYIYSLDYETSIFKSYPSFIFHMKITISNLAENYCYLYANTKNRNKIVELRAKEFNDIFNKKYLDTVNSDMKTIKKKFSEAFIEFMEREYLPYIFIIFQKNYKKTIENMNEIIDFLLNKYSNNENNK